MTSHSPVCRPTRTSRPSGARPPRRSPPRSAPRATARRRRRSRKASPIVLTSRPPKRSISRRTRGLVGAEQVAPARVAQARGVAGRADDVAEEDRQQLARRPCRERPPVRNSSISPSSVGAVDRRPAGCRRPRARRSARPGSARPGSASGARRSGGRPCGAGSASGRAARRAGGVMSWSPVGVHEPQQLAGARGQALHARQPRLHAAASSARDGRDLVEVGAGAPAPRASRAHIAARPSAS